MEVESSSLATAAASSSPKNGNPISETFEKDAEATKVIDEHNLKTNNQSCEASPTLKEPSVNGKDVSTPHNQQILSVIPLGSLAELERTRPPSKPAQVSTKSVNFNPAFPLPSAAPWNIPN